MCFVPHSLITTQPVPETKEWSINIYGMNLAERLAGAKGQFCIPREGAMIYFGKWEIFVQDSSIRRIICWVQEKVFKAKKKTGIGARL